MKEFVIEHELYKHNLLNYKLEEEQLVNNHSTNDKFVSDGTLENENIEYSSNTIMSNIRKLLEYMDVDFFQLVTIIRKYNILLSGYFLLCAINNEIDLLDFNDIDLFVFGDRNELLEQSIGALYLNQRYDLNNVSCSDNIFMPSINYENFGINSVTTFYSRSEFDYKNLKIQIIYIDKNKYYDLSECIRNFDFDVCMNYWDGEKIKIINPNSIKQKTITLYEDDTTFTFTDRKKLRIYKYTKRGWNFRINFLKFNFVYDVLFVIEQEKKEQLTELKIKYRNLIIYYMDDRFNTQNHHIFSKKLENLIIYNFWAYDELNNLPINLKNLIIYDDFIDLQNKKHKTDKNYDTYKDVAKEKYLRVKIPYNCKFILNDIIQ